MMGAGVLGREYRPVGREGYCLLTSGDQLYIVGAPVWTPARAGSWDGCGPLGRWECWRRAKCSVEMLYLKNKKHQKWERKPRLSQNYPGHEGQGSHPEYVLKDPILSPLGKSRWSLGTLPPKVRLPKQSNQYSGESGLPAQAKLPLLPHLAPRIPRMLSRSPMDGSICRSPS